MTHNVKCADINECDTGDHNCHPNAQCTNMVGTFSCACSSGFDGNGVTCTGISIVKIPSYYSSTSCNAYNIIILMISVKFFTAPYIYR